MLEYTSRRSAGAWGYLQARSTRCGDGFMTGQGLFHGTGQGIPTPSSSLSSSYYTPLHTYGHAHITTKCHARTITDMHPRIHT